jgi:hypothetical protein
MDKEGNKSIEAILEKQQLDGAAQLEVLKNIESDAKIDRILQVAQVVEEKHIQDDENDMLNETKIFNGIITEIKDSIDDTYLLQVEQLDKLTNIEKLIDTVAFGGTSYTSEEKLENIKREERSISLLEEIAKNIGLLKEPEKEEKKPESEGFGLGKFLTGLAIALGALAGIVGAYVKQFKFFLKGFTYFVEEFKKAFKFLNPKLYEDIAKDIEMGLSKIRKVFSSIGEWVETTISKFKKIFTFGEDSKIGKIITGFKQSISNFFEPFVEMFKGESKLGKVVSSLKTAATMFFEPFLIAFEELKGFFTSGPVGTILKTLKNTFGFIGEGLAKFGSLFGKVAGIVGKLFLPLTIIMTAWDTIKGAIEGFEKGGIIGGITGAIKGLVDSVIMAPLDALKSIVSWIAEKFGFDSISKALDSFSFASMFDSLFDTIPEAKKAFFDNINNALQTVVTDIGEWFSSIGDDLLSMLAGIGIPEFTIPVPEWMGGPITLGPWYPFKDESVPENAPKKSNTDTNKQTAPENVSKEEIKDEKSKVSVMGANKVATEEPTKPGTKYIPYKEPTKPGEPVKVESVESIKAEEPTKPGEPVKVESVESIKAEEPTKPGTKYIPYKEPTKPGEPVKVESIKAEEPTKPGEPVKVESVKAEEPTVENKPQQVIRTLDKVEPTKPKIEKPWWASSLGDDEFKPVAPTKTKPEVQRKSTSDYVLAEQSTQVEPVKVQSVNVKNSELMGDDPSKNAEIVKRGVAQQRESEQLIPTDNGWMNPQVETTPRPSIEQQLNNLDAQQLNNLDAQQSKFVKPEQLKPEQLIPTDNGWMNPQVETTPRPSIEQQLNNLDAQQVYQKSAENVDKKEDMSTKSGGSTVVSAPTVNTSNKTVNQQSIKLPTRNSDSTSSRYISSRYAIQ